MNSAFSEALVARSLFVVPVVADHLSFHHLAAGRVALGAVPLFALKVNPFSKAVATRGCLILLSLLPFPWALENV